MRVLQILYSGLGGHGSVALSLADAARAEVGWESQFVFLGVEPALASYIGTCVANGYPHAEVRTRPGVHWLAWRSLYGAISQLRPDAIVLHSVKAILPVALYASRRSIPLIAVEHQPIILKSKAEWCVSRLLQRFAGAVVMLTDDYYTRMEAKLRPGWRPEKVHLIPNGIDVDVFSAAPRRVARTLRIGMAARMTSMKRQEILIEALSQLRRDGADWQLSLAGDGERHFELRAHAARLGLAEVVEFPGYLDEAALVRWFRDIDFYAHASDGETLSTSLLQALAMGLPIIASDVPGISDLLAKGDGVGLAVGQSPGAFAETFRALRSDPERQSTLRSRARALAEREYSKQAMLARYQRVLESLCRR